MLYLGKEIEKAKAAVPKVVNARKQTGKKAAGKIAKNIQTKAVSAIPKRLKATTGTAKQITQKAAAAIPKVINPRNINPAKKAIDRGKNTAKEKGKQIKKIIDKKVKDGKERKERILDKLKKEWEDACTTVKRGTLTIGAVTAETVATGKKNWSEFQDRFLGRGKYARVDAITGAVPWIRKDDATTEAARGKVNIKPEVESEMIKKVGDDKGTGDDDIKEAIYVSSVNMWIKTQLEINSDNKKLINAHTLTLYDAEINKEITRFTVPYKEDYKFDIKMTQLTKKHPQTWSEPIDNGLDAASDLAGSISVASQGNISADYVTVAAFAAGVTKSMIDLNIPAKPDDIRIAVSVVDPNRKVNETSQIADYKVINYVRYVESEDEYRTYDTSDKGWYYPLFDGFARDKYYPSDYEKLNKYNFK
ncbi:hypothetical protein SAMN05446037_101323 [Anaerovirgula multivorans]|uniref:Uncharacterized protein n=1 Tax=Anaerovirgula multivorans TaxID=312168 RepID=A0A239FJT5_9FIRM|nr:hypothetical protein [Anaerovirgula multivorans]SNS56492.1 hypothetical protein SAMN05446037_101323 [Anaerovirgula multivorans]